MTTPYTPKIGDILTGVDARGVRGPAPVMTPLGEKGGLRVRFDFDHRSAAGNLYPSGRHWNVQPDGFILGPDIRVLFEPWQEPAAEAAPKLTTIGDIARKGVKPGTVVAVHLVVPDGQTPWNTQRVLRLADAFDSAFWPHRDTPCTIISEPEPEPWKAGDEAVWLKVYRVKIIAIDGGEAWVRGVGVSGAVPLSKLERPQ